MLVRSGSSRSTRFGVKVWHSLGTSVIAIAAALLVVLAGSSWSFSTAPESQVRRRELLCAGGAAASLGAKSAAEISSEFFKTVGGADTPGGPAVVLNNGLLFPKASFGPQVYMFNGDQTCRELTRAAIDAGYRNFFSSVLARNQRGFAQGVKDSGIKRDEIFICGSVNTINSQGFEQAYKDTKRGCQENLEAFAVGGIDYVDMIMLDYPAKDAESIRGQWKAFEEMLQAGQTKSLAVSNFGVTQLNELMQDPATTPPTVNQLRFNLDAYNNTLARLIVAESKRRGVVVQAWSPLRVGGRKQQLAQEIGKRYGKSAAQVMLRWIVQIGATYTTQSSKVERLAENVRIFDFELSKDEMKQLGSST